MILCGNFNLNMENNIALFRAVHRYIHATIKFGELLSICSQHIERNEHLTSIKGHNSFTHFRKMTGNNHNIDLVNINTYTKFGQILSNSS